MKAFRLAPRRTTALLRPTPQSQTRTFLPNPFGGSANPAPQTLTATRTLPYPGAAIYNIIADVSSYSSFLPYCQSSAVTKWSRPDDKTGKRWPEAATLAVGWQSITEEFTSRIYCVPGSVVEAVGGRSRTSLDPAEIKHHDSPTDESLKAGGADRGLLTHLLTRWTVSPFPYHPPHPDGASPSTTGDSPGGQTGPHSPIDPQKPASGQPREQTQVTLAIEFAFANPIYSTMSAAVTPAVASMMIEAFEKRVEKLLDGPGLGGTKRKLPGEGVMGTSRTLKA